MRKYSVKSTIVGQAIYQGKVLIALINENLDNPLGVAEGIVKVLNSQNKYILPTKNYGGGYIRVLTKEELQRQRDIIEHRIILGDE